MHSVAGIKESFGRGWGQRRSMFERLACGALAIDRLARDNKMAYTQSAGAEWYEVPCGRIEFGRLMC